MHSKIRVLSDSLHLGDSESWDYCFDNRKLLHSSPTSVLVEITDILWNKIKHLNPQVFVGKGIGSYPLLISLKLKAYQEGIDTNVLFVRDSRKEKGNFRKIIEGPLPEEILNHNAIFIDDLFNYGDTFNLVKTQLFNEGFNINIIAIAVIIDFWNGSRKLTATGFPFFSVWRRHDLGITRKDDNLPKLLNDVKWQIQEHHNGIDYMPTKSMPVIYKNKVYVGNDDTHLYCYDISNGSLLWRYESKKPSLKGSVCVAKCHDDKVFWTSYDGTVRCLNGDTGSPIWTVKADLNLHSAVELDEKNNRLFVGTEWDKQLNWYGRGDIICLNMTSGYEIWRTPTRGMIPATPSFSEKHNIVICGSNDFHVYFLNADNGGLLFKIPTKGEVKGKPAISHENDLVIVQTIKGFVYAINFSGQVLWTSRVGLKSLHPYPVVIEDKVYVTNMSSFVICLDIKTGNKLWVTKLRGNVGWGVTLIESNIAALTHNGYLVFLNKDTGEKIMSDTLQRKSHVTSKVTAYQPCAYENKNLVIATNNEGIICYSLEKEIK